MTRSQVRSHAQPGCSHVAPELVAAYARGQLDMATLWSVEAHLPACEACRLVLATEVDRHRLDRNRSVLMARLALPAAGPAERVVIRCGIAPHIWRLLSVTPSLRRSWLAGIALVLGTAVGSARLWPAVAGSGVTGLSGQVMSLDGRAPSGGMLLFLILAPLLPLAGVAAAFHPRLDPAADLATAAPVSGIWLFCVRSVAVMVAALVPVITAGFLLPGSGWLPFLVVLPALAVSATTLALATLTGIQTAAISAGTGWGVLTAGLGLAGGSPAGAYGGVAQAVSLAVIVMAGCMLAIRRHNLDLGWNR
jgi:hypothetical protein